MSIRDDYSSLKKNRIAVLGISTDGVESHKKFAGKHELPFTILADEDAKVARTYGVYGMKVFMGRRYMGVKRTTFLIDADGRIVKIMPKVDVKNHAAEILEAFRAGRKGHP
jgi:peroxiredoxin Q/BCP